MDGYMETHTINFNGNEICKAEIVDKELVITDYDIKRLFAIHMYVGYTLKRFDFLSTYRKKDNALRYPLRTSDVLHLVREGFKFSTCQ